MTTPAAAAHLYSRTTTLAYSETQRAFNPRMPFQMADQPALRAQAQAVADSAAAFRGRNPAPMSDLNVNAAMRAVGVAQAMFDAIENEIVNNLSKGQVEQAVTTAVNAVNAC